MTRKELRDTFRVENPEIKTRVIADTALNSYLKTANVEIACITRCIMSNTSEVITSVANTQYYDLEANITNFYDIDDMPGGGVYYNDKRLRKSSPGEENYRNATWKGRSSGTPLRYWRRGEWLWLDKAPDTSAIEIAVDCIYIPDDFDADSKEPFNDLGHLQPYSDALLKYLQYRCKQKVGKYEEARVAKKEYEGYLKWMGTRVRSAKYGPIHIKPAAR